MSRYTITVSGHRRSDPEVIIGYDHPRTFPLHAFRRSNCVFGTPIRRKKVLSSSEPRLAAPLPASTSHAAA